MMDSSSKTAGPDGTGLSILGVVAIVAGMFCMLMPGLTGLSIITFVGVLVLITGVVRMIWAFKAGSLGKGLFVFAVGGLTLLAGIALLAHPVFASGVLTIILAIYFFADGISEVANGARLRPEPGSGWLIFAGIVSILLGIMIWRQYPVSGMWAIGVLFGIKLFFVGLIMVTGGSVVRKITKEI
jgi:uncharacterized membrane protein HdeD (DUF308 family)